MLSQESLKSRMINELKKRGFNLEAVGRDQQTWLLLFLEAIAKAIIDEIQQNARTKMEDERIV
jgi:hypothetical protein